jgi:hypothetical protein
VRSWDHNGSSGDWLGGCGLDSTGTGQGPVAGCCECGDEPSGSCATELVSHIAIFLAKTGTLSLQWNIMKPDDRVLGCAV